MVSLLPHHGYLFEMIEGDRWLSACLIMVESRGLFLEE